MDFVYSHEKRVLNIATPREQCVWLYKRTQSKRRIENRISDTIIRIVKSVDDNCVKKCKNAQLFSYENSIPTTEVITQ